MKMSRKLFLLLFTFMFLGLLFFKLTGQESEGNRKLFDLKKAELTLKEVKLSYESALELKKNGLISEEEFSKKATAYLKAKVEYQRALIDFSGSEARIIVQSAFKWVDPKGRPHARLTLLYSARDIEALYSMGIKEDLFPLDFLKEIKDIYVSLYSDDYIISDPYQLRIPSMALGKTKSVDFILLKDVESLEIFTYYTGKKEKTRVYLLKDSTVNIVMIRSTQFSQQVDLGGEASFDLSLERYTRESSVFKLHVLGLPQEISHEFIDPGSNARLSQIKFPEGKTSMKLVLNVHLPRNLPENLSIDKAFSFRALCLDIDEANKLDMALKKEQNQEVIIKDIKGGNVKLEIIPQGVGKIELSAVNLYYDISIDEIVDMAITAKNTGTRRLNNIKITADSPLEWKNEISPEFIRQLDQDKEIEIKLKFIPPVNVPVGDYEIKIKAESVSGGMNVESETKVLRIHMSSKSNIWGTIILVALLIGLIAAIVIFGIKLTKR